MNWFWKKEKRAEDGGVKIESSLLQAILQNTKISKERALQIPTVSGAVDKLAATVAKLPIKLYRMEDGQVVELKDDKRVYLLNKDTGDTLTTVNFWKAMIEDFYLDKGGFAYLEKSKGEIAAIRYVDAAKIQINVRPDPIFKDYDIYVSGRKFFPFDFLKILRKTKDGCRSVPICEENSTILAVAYNSLVFEDNLVKKGGNKRGFLCAKNRVSNPEQIRKDFSNLYDPSSDSIVILNDGMEFKESSSSSVEMQLNENKVTNADEILKLFGFPSTVLQGGASAEDRELFTEAVVNLLNTIEAALDKDLLLEREKGSCYFSFDTKELTRGNIKERFEAYGIALDKHFMQPDEVRKMEELEPLGFNFLKLGLGDVLYNPSTKQVFVPNTNQTSTVGDSDGAHLPDETV